MGSLLKLKNDFSTNLKNYYEANHLSGPTDDRGLQPPVQVRYFETDYYRGNGGGVYDSKTPAYSMMTERKVLIRFGEYVDSIQFLLSDDGVNLSYTPYAGGFGGSAHEWDVPYGEYITQIEVRSGNMSIRLLLLLIRVVGHSSLEAMEDHTLW